MTTKKDVLDFFCATSEAGAERTLYKQTDCGAWIEFKADGIVLGSIVEGLDFGTVTYPLNYADNFTHEDIAARIDAIEKEAAALWDWGNRPCDKQGRWRKNGSTTHAELGLDAPDVSWEYRHLNQGERSA